MSKYHILGITGTGILEQIISSDDKEHALRISTAYISAYRQLFLVESTKAPRALTYTPPAVATGTWEESDRPRITPPHRA